VLAQNNNYCNCTFGFLSHDSIAVTAPILVEEAEVGVDMEYQLRKLFTEGLYDSTKAKLFQSFETYASSLPTREYKGADGSGLCLRLYELPYVVRREEVDFMVKKLKSLPAPARRTVKYIAAPSGSGKSACLLPAFLHGQKSAHSFTHYLYLAFNNNCGRSFRVLHQPTADTEIAQMQGAAFIFECLKALLENEIKEWPCVINMDPNPCKVDTTRERIGKYLRNALGESCKCLIHLDEHKKMCLPPIGCEQYGEYFSRGAMEALVYAAGVAEVVATYVDRLRLPARGSSEICRQPLVLPSLDMIQVANRVKELKMDYDLGKLTAHQKRKYATIMFRLGCKMLTEFHIMNIMHCRGTSEAAEKFLMDFQDAGQKDVKASLRDRYELCALSIEDFDDPTENVLAPELLLGIREVEIDDLNAAVPNIILIHRNRISSSLQTLFTMSSSECPVYEAGQELLYSVLSSTTADYLSNTPLEAAFAWTLSVRSSVYGKIQFFSDTPVFKMRCKDLLPGRIFTSDTNANYNMDLVKKNVFYYVKGGKNLPNHPLADIFFRTKANELVLIDVTGGGRHDAKKKRGKLEKWISSEKSSIKKTTGLDVYGVVLAPVDTSMKSSYDAGTQVMVVRGGDAMKLLGGLDQIFRWMG